MFGGGSVNPTGMFGTPLTSSPSSTAPTTFIYGAASSGDSFSSSGGSSAFGGFRSNTRPNPFGRSSQPSQPAFVSGSGLFAFAPPFGAPSQPALGNSTAPALGSSSTPMPSFSSGSTPAFGASSCPVSGSSAFGSTGTGFRLSSTPVSGSVGASGASTICSAFGSSSTPAFGATASAYRAPTNGKSESISATLPAEELESISAMPVYEDKSHEELRWEDYHQLGVKGGPAPPGQSSGGIGFNATPPLSNGISASSQTSSIPATSSLFAPPRSNGGSFAFGQKPEFGGFGSNTQANPFGSSSQPSQPAYGGSGLFGSTQPSQPAFGNPTAPAFGSSSTPMPSFCTTPNAFVFIPSPFLSTSTSIVPISSLFVLGTSSSSTPWLFSWPTTQPFLAPLGSGWTLENPQTCSLFGQTGNIFGQANHKCGSSGTSASSFFSSTPINKQQCKQYKCKHFCGAI